MAVPEGVNTWQGRLDTFAESHHLPKRRASSTKKKGAGTVAWPHESPSADNLAQAGFYYKPDSASNDNCQCFLCGVKLDGWEDGDDPITEHLTHSPECGWAVSMSIRRNFNEGRIEDSDPMREELVEARKQTFGDKWPYESKKNWKPKIAKMVAAGWMYDPSPEYDDSVTCVYCNLSLDGWEPKDDPHAEHLKRVPDCPFFELAEKWAASRKPTKGKKGRTSRASKGSRLSTQSVVSVASEAPSQLSLGDLDADEPAALDESMMSTATVSSTTGKGKRKKAPAKGTRKGGRGKKAADDSVMEVDQSIQLEEQSVTEPRKATRKASRSKKAKAVAEDSVMEVDPPMEVEYPTIVDEPPKRQTRRKASKQEPPSMIDDTLDASQSQRPTRGRKAKAKEVPRMSEDEAQLHSELAAALESSMIESQQPPKATRGTKRTSDGAPKADSSVVVIDDTSMTQSQAEKPKRGRKPKAAQKQPEPEPEEETQPRSSDASEIQRVSSLPRIAPKSKKGKKAAKAATPEAEAEPEPEDEVDMLDVENDFDMAQSLVNPINPYRPMTGTPDRDPNEPSPAPSTPTPAKTQDLASSQIRRPLPAIPPSASKQPAPREATPQASSPNSSDAENKPPSSRPASARPPLSVKRIPLQPGTPNRHLQLSPSKRPLGGLKSELPWSPTAIETVFLNSPVKQNLADKENALHMKGTNIESLDPKGLKEVVRRVRDVLGKEEKEMTVEQWVRWNAQVGEERLRRECEALVMMFEKEGGRALRCLEGVEVSD